MELCTCPSFQKHTINDASGNICHGLLVHRSTRTHHWAKACSQSDETLILDASTLHSLTSKIKDSLETTKKNDEDKITPKPTQQNNSEIISVLLYFILWLHLVCGLSKEKCHKARDMIIYAIHLVSSKCNSDHQLTLGVPHDLQTIVKRFKIESSFERFVCCQQCYSLYDIEVAPDECHYRPTSQSSPCGTNLFRQSKFKSLPSIQFTSNQSAKRSFPKQCGQIRLSGQPRLRVPYANFISQSLSTWVKWFLNVPGIEEELNEWASSISSQRTSSIIDVSQGKVWRKIFGNSSTQLDLELGFSLFIDWFNPQGNRISGKQTSMGLIALNCLNLPPRLRFKHCYTCLAGIIPAPRQPNMLTMNNVLKPIVDELRELNQGIRIITPKYPHSRKVSIRVVSLIGDVVATHKVSGFMSHSAKKFCSWCDIKSDER
ncbi:hypothetical protein O181_089661, partial [Austropuccinia psidii MF-1]|nr:hypothetical protein [Austropuccinia psidii MF-1]